MTTPPQQSDSFVARRLVALLTRIRNTAQETLQAILTVDARRVKFDVSRRDMNAVMTNLEGSYWPNETVQLYYAFNDASRECDKLGRDDIYREMDLQAWRAAERQRRIAEEAVSAFLAHANDLLQTIEPACGSNGGQADAVDQSADRPPDRRRSSPDKARKLLTGWHDICAALGTPYDRRGDIKSLNERCGGPIKNKGTGTRPMVYRDDLIDWFNKIAIQHEDAANQREGERLAAAEQHAHGRDGIAAPGVGGGVKRRRRRAT